MSLITMSQQELNRLEAIRKIRDRRLSVLQAAGLLALSRSQIRRLLQAYDREGPAGLVSKNRGQPSNRCQSDEFRNIVLDLVREHYHDFSPTLAREKLIELHQISIGKETLHRWMTDAGLWTSRRERKQRVFQPRGRRDCLGELVQIDGSHHWWFENRGPKCALLVNFDDATGKLLHLRFAMSENTFDRANRTLQYRLVKELRLQGIDTIETTNEFVPQLIADFNSRFGKGPSNPKDMHRPLAAHENLDGAMCRKEVRTVSQSLTLRYEKVIFILDPTDYAKTLPRQKVIVCDYPDGRLEIMHEGTILPYGIRHIALSS